VPPKPYKDDGNYQKIAGRLAKELPNAIWAQQFDNVVNRQAHYETTGPGDLARHRRARRCVRERGRNGRHARGHRAFLKEKKPGVRIVLADPHGSALYSWKKTGELTAEGSSITEGIGTTRITAKLRRHAGGRRDPGGRPVRRDDGLPAIARGGLVRGRFHGHQCRRRVETAKVLGPGHTIVTLLCDRGSLYGQRLFNAAWLKEKGLTPG
jgi:cysteine synthase A